MKHKKIIAIILACSMMNCLPVTSMAYGDFYNDEAVCNESDESGSGLDITDVDEDMYIEEFDDETEMDISAPDSEEFTDEEANLPDEQACEADLSEQEETVEEESEEDREFEFGEATQFYKEQPKIMAAIDHLEAFKDTYGMDYAIFTKGSYQFFSDMGANDALAYLNDPAAVSYMNPGSADDATSIENMLYSLNYIYQCNKIRASIGLSQLKVSDKAMAGAQVSANAAALTYSHPKIAKMNGEILAWNYDDPFEGWYYDEKKDYDKGVREFEKIGHYIIIIEPDYQITGFGLNYARKTYGYTYTCCEEFSYTGNGYSVDAYTDRLIKWIDDYIADVERASESEENIKAFVTRLYEVCLGRHPDEAGAAYWVNALKSGKSTGAQAAGGFIFSDESVRKNLCNACFIDQLYSCFMGRKADSNGKTYWLDKMAKGAGRAEVFGGFVSSNEFRKICDQYGITVGSAVWDKSTGMLEGDCKNCGAKHKTVYDFVERMYSVCLGRKADPNGLAFWIEKLRKGETGENVAMGFIFSKELVAKHLSDSDFIDCLYRAFFGRHADSGKNYWMNQLDSGKSRESVVKGFAASNEFKLLCLQYGIQAR